MRLWALSGMLAASSVALAANVNGSLQFDTILPDISHVPVHSRILLDYGEKSALIRQDGSFEIPDVADGHHILTPVVPGYVIWPLLLTVDSDSVHVQIHNPAKEPLPTTVPSHGHPIKLIARGKEDFFTAKMGFNLFGMLRSPMILLMLFAGAMMFGLPKLTAYIESDPEMAREMANQRKKMNSYQNMDWTENISTMLAGGEGESTGRASPGAGPGMKKRKGK